MRKMLGLAAILALALIAAAPGSLGQTGVSVQYESSDVTSGVVTIGGGHGLMYAVFASDLALLAQGNADRNVVAVPVTHHGPGLDGALLFVTVGAETFMLRDTEWQWD
jgi:hypothetical protein